MSTLSHREHTEIRRRQVEAREQDIADRLERLRYELPEPTGFEDEDTRAFLAANRYLRQAGCPTLRPILPLLLRLKGKPYTLDEHFPFEPFFRTRVPREILFKCGRQVAKSTSLAAQGVVTSCSIPYFSTLYVTPLYEMTRRFSHQYVRPFIEDGPFRKLFTGKASVNNVLQRSFLNGSSMYFSYAFLDAERTRGIPADRRVVDEVSLLQYDFLPIIDETLSASPWQLKQASGTPTSLDNTMEALWSDSSQAEFMVKCHHAGCGAWNVPALAHDLIDMIGPWHRGISAECPGVICATCAKPLDPRLFGRWVHAHPERRWDFAGLHIPQILMPMHYADQEKWDSLVGKMQGKGNTTTTVFLNEVCGESCDTGSKLVTETDLKQASCLPWTRTTREAEEAVARQRYRFKILAVDWGGGGGRVSQSKKDADKRLRTSYTTLAAMGLRRDHKIDVFWGYRSLRTHDMLWEAQLVIEAIKKFGCSHLVHDYGGAGEGRIVLVNQAGFPPSHTINMQYVGPAAHDIVVHVPASIDHPRDVYEVDKSRSLVTICQCIKHGLLRFFQYDYKGADDLGLIRDFLALQEEKIDSRMGTDVYVITRNPNMSDDFAQAVNIGACTLYYMSGRWPDIADAAKYQIDPALLARIHPRTKVDWDDM